MEHALDSLRDLIGCLERGDTLQINVEALRRLALVLEVTTDRLLAMDAEERPTIEDSTGQLSCPPA